MMEQQQQLKLCVFLALFSVHLIAVANPVSNKIYATEDEAKAYLESLENEYSHQCNIQTENRWKYATNITKENEDASVQALNKFLEYQATVQAEILERFANWQEYQNATIKRQFKYLAQRGPARMDTQHVNEMNKIATDMESLYSSAKVCEYGDSNPSTCRKLSLDPELTEMLKTNKNYDELAYYWTEWHNVLAKAVPTSVYKTFTDYQNEYARANSYPNMAEMWAAAYDDGSANFSLETLRKQMSDIWAQLKPNYEKLHAYVRMKLRNDPRFASKVKKFGYLPANLLGNMWAQEWTSLADDTKPYPDAPSFDATEAMKKANYDATIMFQKANEFFKDLGLMEMTDTFWQKSMIVKPADGREVVCHASAEDLCLGKGSTDFRIKMCTKVTQDDFITVHHEMGHIEYFMQYTDLPYIFRDGANPGFHEAIGDALALAVSTPSHLQCKLGLDIGYDCSQVSNPTEISPTDINYLYIQALEKFAFFPFALAMDSWRWDIFEGKINESDYNSKWWEMRQSYQGIAPPSSRANSEGLDAAAKYHIVANVEYLRYFISHILQFQFYEAMCIAAGEFDPNNSTSKPLHTCDFSGSTEAGQKFADMMKLGFSQPWPEALQAITGSNKMSTSSLLNYFKPVFDHIDQELSRAGEVTGFGTASEDLAKEYVSGYYETEMTRYCHDSGVAEFNYETNLTSAEAEQGAQRAKLEYSAFEIAEYNANISQFDYESFVDEDLKRQFRILSKVGVSALDPVELQEYTEILANMSKIYGTAKICPYAKQDCDLETEGLSLEPHMEEILRNMGSYNEMAYVWKSWRDASGQQMRELYERYIDLSNKAAQLNGFNNMGDYWLNPYESDTFREEIGQIWQVLKTELYEPLYDYVRHKLSQRYPQMDPEAAMPAHVFGNMWAQSWENVLPFVLPFPNASSFDVTTALQAEANRPGWGSEIDKRVMIFNYANMFFTKLGLGDMKVAFGSDAMIMKPSDGREVICHASAWDMCDGKDFRLKMCTEIDHDSFITAHHELGHIQYYIQYKDLPYAYRSGANPGFHEAIGDLIALSVSTPEHLNKIGLLSAEVTEESLLNYQMQMGLDKIAFLPFAYMIDSYRWQVFSEEIPKQNLTYNWIKLRAELQGITPPFRRDEQDFDAGAKYHVASDTPYIRYFVSYILQFQLHQKLCEVAGQAPAKPLHECDINGNAAAGELLKKILRSGASKNWSQLLQDVLGTSKLDPAPMISYFQPLMTFLKAQADSEKYPRGWDVSDIDFFYGDGDFATPTEPTTTTTTTTTTTPTGSTGTSEPDPDPVTNPPEEDDEVNKTALIAVGVALGVAVVAALIGYLVWKKIRK